MPFCRMRSARRRLTTASILTGLYALAPLAHADQTSADLDLKSLAPGQWRVARSVILAALPLPPKPKTILYCIDPAKGETALDLTVLKDEELPFLQNCKVSDESKAAEDDPKHLKVTLACTPDLAKKGVIDVTLTGKDKILAVSVFSKEEGQVWMTYRESATWLGPCVKTP